MKEKLPAAPGWGRLPPAEPDIFKNFAGCLHGLQFLEALADTLGDQMEDAASHGIPPESASTFTQKIAALSDHLGELAWRMEDDNFFPVGPEHDPPLEDAKQRAFAYIMQHPGTPDHVLTWFLRCTNERADRCDCSGPAQRGEDPHEGGRILCLTELMNSTREIPLNSKNFCPRS